MAPILLSTLGVRGIIHPSIYMALIGKSIQVIHIFVRYTQFVRSIWLISPSTTMSFRNFHCLSLHHHQKVHFIWWSKLALPMEVSIFNQAMILWQSGEGRSIKTITPWQFIKMPKTIEGYTFSYMVSMNSLN